MKHHLEVVQGSGFSVDIVFTTNRISSPLALIALIQCLSRSLIISLIFFESGFTGNGDLERLHFALL